MNDVAALLKRTAPLLLPSLVKLEFKRAAGVLLLQLQDANDFILASIGASSANIKCELHNCFDATSKVPRSIESCCLLFELAAGLTDERLVYFMWEIANLKLKDGSLAEADYAALASDLKRLSFEFSGASDE